MIELSIDGNMVLAPEGATVLDAIRIAGKDVPVLCFRETLERYTSCMVCVVEDRRSGNLIPACSSSAAAYRDIVTASEEVLAARRAALELLMDEHLGDCEGPCRRACPADMHIPRMIRKLGGRLYGDALETVREHIPFPAVLGRICPAPCERTCRRGRIDSPIPIALLERSLGDAAVGDTAAAPPCASREKVAIVGAGPAGLSAAFYLSSQGYTCTVFDGNTEAGGALRYSIDEDRLPRAILDAEIASLHARGVAFCMQALVGVDVSLEDLHSAFDAIIVATGTPTACQPTPVLASPGPASGVFVAGNAARSNPSRMAVRAVADGRTAAVATVRLLSGTKAMTAYSRFDSRMPGISVEEIHEMAETSHAAGLDRTHPAAPLPVPASEPSLLPDRMTAEAKRCIRCDCARQSSCRLRDLADEYAVQANRYSSHRRTTEMRFPSRRFERRTDSISASRWISFEPGKCMKCGLCVRISAEAGDSPGLCFTGRGIDVEVAVPFGEPLGRSLKKSALLCAEACPTGALVVESTPW